MLAYLFRLERVPLPYHINENHISDVTTSVFYNCRRQHCDVSTAVLFRLATVFVPPINQSPFLSLQLIFHLFPKLIGLSSMESNNTTVSHRREEEEDENMEMFVALMNSFRNKLHQLHQNRSNKRKRPSTSAPAAGWAPAFQLEDFTTDIQFKKHVPPEPCNNINAISEHSNSPNLKLRLWVINFLIYKYIYSICIFSIACILCFISLINISHGYNIMMSFNTVHMAILNWSIWDTVDNRWTSGSC